MKFTRNNNIKSNKKVSELHCCPICGHMPKLTQDSAAEDNGRGYPDDYWFALECSFCTIMPESDSFMAEDYSEVEEELVNAWNKDCEEIETLLEWRKRK